MKMQEVITQLRKLAPAVEMDVRVACEDFENLRDVLKDADHTISPVSLRVLLAACSEKADMISEVLCHARDSINSLATVNREYKEKLGPRTKKPKDAEGQQMLPGIGDEGGTPTTMGETSTTGGGTPSFMQSRTPSFMQSGRHG